MSAEVAGGGKFSQFVTDHIFRYINRDKFFAVVYRQSQTNKVRGDGGAPGPGFDDAAILSFFGPKHFGQQAGLNKRSFFYLKLVCFSFIDSFYF
jgi:hypothetical protein